MIGKVTGPITFDGMNYTSVETYDWILTKINNSGTASFKKFINIGPSGTITPYVIKVDNNQNIYFLGRFTGSITIGGKTITSSTTINAFIAKFDINGNCSWITAFESSGTYILNYIFRIAIDNNGNSYIISATDKLLKFSSGGILLWEQIYPSGTLQAVAINGSNLFIGGAVSVSTTFGSYTLNPNCPYAGFLARADLDGVYNLATQIQNVAAPILSSKQGVYYSTGTFNHPTAGLRTINQNKTLTGISEDVLETTIGDLATTVGNLLLTINADNSVTIGGTCISATYGSVAVVATTGLENKYVPAEKKFYLHYEYTFPDGKRTISEEMTYQVLNPNTSMITDIAITSEGKIVISGFHNLSIFLNPVTITKTSASKCTFIAKCANNFVFEWAYSSSEIAVSDPYTFRIFLDNSNNIYEYALITNSFTFGSFVVNSAGGQVLIKFDSGGNAISSYAIQNTTAERIFTSPSGKLSCTGSYNYGGAPFYGNMYLIQYDVQSGAMSEDWKKVSSSQSGTARIFNIKHDNLGNTYIKSRVRGYCNFFGTVIKKDNEVTVIAKLDINGNLVWLNLIQDYFGYSTGPNLKIDKNHNLVTYSVFGASLDLGTETFVNLNGFDDGYIIKYNENGLRSWAVQLNTDGIIDIIGVTTDEENNIIVSGKFTDKMTVLGNSINVGSVEGVFLLKLDPDGNFLWAKGFPIGGVVYLAMADCDALNNIYLTADIATPTGNTLTFGTVSAPQPETEATVLVKFDLYGNAKWVKTYGADPVNPSGSECFPVDIKTDNAGNSYIYGWFKNNAVFGTTTLTSPYIQDWSYYLTKINTLGGIIWIKPIYEKNYSFNYGDLLDLDENGNVYTGGHFKDEISVETVTYTPVGTNDFFLAKYSTTGVLQWFKTIPASSNIMSAIAVFGDNVLSIGGYAGINSSLGSFVIDKKSGPTSIIATLGDLELTTNTPDNFKINTENIILYPNPNHGKFYIQLDKFECDNIRLSLYNSIGVFSRDMVINKIQGQNFHEIDLGNVDKGLYFIRIQSDKLNIVKTLVIE
ncbi:MAG: T9SS type A sorting domain-containing protein [Bacteroidia bacterium]|nr:T9SS type A sorting domain-containing protein [Bacteroidia bacterium]